MQEPLGADLVEHDFVFRIGFPVTAVLHVGAQSHRLTDSRRHRRRINALNTGGFRPVQAEANRRFERALRALSVAHFIGAGGRAARHCPGLTARSQCPGNLGFCLFRRQHNSKGATLLDTDKSPALIDREMRGLHPIIAGRLETIVRTYGNICHRFAVLIGKPEYQGYRIVIVSDPAVEEWRNRLARCSSSGCGEVTEMLRQLGKQGCRLQT